MITCGINGCQRVYTNLGTFKKHLHGMHGDGIDNTMMTDSAPESEIPCCSGSNSSSTHRDDVQETGVMGRGHRDHVVDAD